MNIKREVFRINEEGYIVEKHVAEFDDEGNCLDEFEVDIITVQPPQGLYRARWNGTEWIEDMSQEEIAALNNYPKPPTTEDRLQMAEDTILYLLMNGGI